MCCVQSYVDFENEKQKWSECLCCFISLLRAPARETAHAKKMKYVLQFCSILCHCRVKKINDQSNYCIVPSHLKNNDLLCAKLCRV